MKQQHELNEERKFLGLDHLRKSTPPPPTGYFDHLPDQLLERWKQEKHIRVSRVLPWRNMIAIAAVMTGIAFGITLLTKLQMDEAKPLEFTSADAYTYILEHIEEFSPMIQQEAELLQPLNVPSAEAEEIEKYLLEEMSEEQIEVIF